MTKQQKIWLWIGLCLAFVPEILWSPVGNLTYEFYQSGRSGGSHPFRENILTNSDNINWLSAILFAQCVGLLILTIMFVKSERSVSRKLVLGTIGCSLTLFVFLLFGLSVSLRSIGF